MNEHRQGCPATGGYGHEREPCICGKTSSTDELIERLNRFAASGYGDWSATAKEAATVLRRLRGQRDFLVEEYERAVDCGPQGYLHAAMHLFNAITNARIDAKLAAATQEVR